MAKEIKSGESIGVCVNGIETRQIKYEEVRDAIIQFSGYRDTLRKLGKAVPRHIEIAIQILSWIKPLYNIFKPKGG